MLPGKESNSLFNCAKNSFRVESALLAKTNCLAESFLAKEALNASTLMAAFPLLALKFFNLHLGRYFKWGGRLYWGMGEGLLMKTT